MTGGNPIDWTDPAALLRAWHVRVLGDTHFDETGYVHTLRQWVTTIEDQIVDPPRKWTVTGHCPLCGEAKITLGNGDHTDVLGAIERDPIHESLIICRACNAVWQGIDGARALRIAIDDHARLSA